MDEIRCSMCGKPNSADNSVCQHCGARLTPLTPSNAGKFTGGLSWLDAFREETGGSGKKEQNPPTPPTPEPEEPQSEESPEWLTHIRARTDQGSLEERDQEIQYDEPEADEQQDSGVDVPDWLRNLKEEPPQKKEEEAIPHWTAALRTWTDDSTQEPAEDEIEEEETATPDQPPKVTDWFNRILPSGEKPAHEQADEEYIDDRDQKVLMDDVDMADWRDSSASLSSIRDSKTVEQDVPSWLEDDTSASSKDPTENLMEWLQSLDQKEGGAGKQKARYWMGEVDTGELAKQKELDPRFAEKEDASLPVYDPFSGEEIGTEPKPDHKATQFFSESELDENDQFKDNRTLQTVYFEEQDETPSEEDLPPWMKKVPDVPPAKPSLAPKMTAALDEGDEEIPDWMKDQPEDKFTKPSLMTASLSGLDDEALGMDLPAEEVPPWMKEQLEDKPASPKLSPAMTVILDDSGEELFGASESPNLESSELPKTPILTAQLSGLDDEDLGMDLPPDEPAPWMKKAEELEPPVKKPPSIFTAALQALEEIPSDDEETPPWEMNADEVGKPIKKPPSIFTAALQAMEDIPSDEEETPPWEMNADQVEKPISKTPSMFTAALRALEEIPSDEEDTPPWELNPEAVENPIHQAPSMMTAALRILEEEPTEEEEIPSWMKELESTGSTSTTPSAPKSDISGELEEKPAQEEEIPSWMKNIEDVTAPLRPSASMMTAALTGLDEEKPAQEEEIPSWMKELEEAAPPIQTSAPKMTAALSGLEEEEPAQEEEIPSWMKELEEAAPPTRPSAPTMTAALSGLEEEEPAQEEEIPSWMKALEEAVPPAQTSAPMMTAALSGLDDNDLGMSESDGDLPAWMKNLEEATAPPRSMMTADGGEVEGFEDFRNEPIERDASTSQPLMTAYFEQEPEEMDSSVDSLPKDTFDEDERIPTGMGLTKALEEDIPDWLTSFNDAIEPAGEPLDVWTGASSSVDLSEQANNLEFEQEEEEEIGNLLPESTVPDWLNEMKQAGESSQPEVSSAFTFESDDLTPENLDTSHPFAGDDLPNWLSPEIWQANGKKAEEVSEEAHIEGVENIQWELEGLEKGELPTWLNQIKPGQPGKTKRHKPEPGKEDTQTEKIGPLAGLMGVLPARDMDMMYRKPPIYSDQIQLTDRQSNRMQVLTRMIESEAKNQPLKVAVEKVPLNLMRILFAVLLVLIMLIPFSGFILMPGSLPFVASDPVVSFHNQVEQYPENSSVLLVMDFESGYTAEMRGTLDGLLNRLYEKRVNVAMISTLPIGPVLAEEIAQDIWLKHYAAHPETNVAEYESRVVNLGYLPGGSAAMLQFLRYPHQTVQYGFRYEKTPSSVWNSNVLTSIQSIDEFAGLIVLTDSPTLSRDWIEQSSLNTKNHMMMVTSAQAYPLILPYWQSGQIKGLIAGLYQGYTYRSLINQSAGLAARWYSYQFGMNLVTLIVILLTLGYIVRNTFSGRKTPR